MRNRRTIGSGTGGINRVISLVLLFMFCFTLLVPPAVAHHDPRYSTSPPLAQEQVDNDGDPWGDAQQSAPDFAWHPVLKSVFGFIAFVFPQCSVISCAIGSKQTSQPTINRVTESERHEINCQIPSGTSRGTTPRR